MATPTTPATEKTAIVISNFFNERYENIQALSQKLRAKKRSVASLGEFASSTAYSKRRRSRSYCRYHKMKRHSRNNKMFPNNALGSGEKSTKNNSKIVACEAHNNIVEYNNSMRLLGRLLKTHKWHTKRFHMTKRWDYCLPRAHLHRGQKFLQRALKSQCLIHDYSYLSQIILQGSLNSLLEAVAKLMDPLHADKCFGSIEKQELFSLKEHQVTFHHPGCFPQGCIGPGTFFICPPYKEDSCQDDPIREMWIYVHPGMHNNVYTGLSNVIANMHGKDVHLEANSSSGIRHTRISVVGYKASELLSRVLIPATMRTTCPESTQNGTYFTKVMQSEGINALWKHNDGLCIEVHDFRDLCFGKDGQSRVRSDDPLRNGIEGSWKNTSAEGRARTTRVHRRETLRPPHKPAADFFVRKESTRSALSDARVRQLRFQHRQEAFQILDNSSALVSSDPNKWSFGSPARSSEKQQQQPSRPLEKTTCPVLLIRKSHLPSSSELPLPLRGWDLLLPESCHKSLWLALHFAGGCSVGFEEMSAVHSCMRLSSFPGDFPDTPEGRQHWKRVKKTLHCQRLLRPKNKRGDMARSGVPEFHALFPDHDRPEAELVVMRNAEFAWPFFPEAMIAGSKSCASDRLEDRLPRDISLKDSSEVVGAASKSPPNFPFPTLIKLTVCASGRGVPQCGALLYRPLEEDYRCWAECRRSRQKPTTSSKRLGDWQGLPSTGDSEREVLGTVTSSFGACQHLWRDNVVAFCEAGKLSSAIAFSTTMTKSGEPLPLLMYRNPLSNILRPAIVQLNFT